MKFFFLTIALVAVGAMASDLRGTMLRAVEKTGSYCALEEELVHSAPGGLLGQLHSVAIDGTGTVVVIGVQTTLLQPSPLPSYTLDPSRLTWNLASALSSPSTSWQDFLRFGKPVVMSRTGRWLATPIAKGVQVFQRGSQAGNWVFHSNVLVLPDSGFQPLSLAIENDILLVGYPAATRPGDASSTGAFRVFQLQMDKWEPVSPVTFAPLGIPRNLAGFGNVVSLSADGRTAAISSFNQRDLLSVLATYTSTPDGRTWTQFGLAKLGIKSDDSFGAALAFNSDGSILAVGAPSLLSTTDGGEVSVYRRLARDYERLQTIIVGPLGTRKAFGASIALSATGDTMLVGAFATDSYTGKAWLFQRRPSLLYEVKTEISFTPAPIINMLMGTTVALSEDGFTAVVAGSRQGKTLVHILRCGPPRPTKRPTLNPTKPYTKGPKATSSPTAQPSNSFESIIGHFLGTKSPTAQQSSNSLNFGMGQFPG